MKIIIFWLDFYRYKPNRIFILSSIKVSFAEVTVPNCVCQEKSDPRARKKVIRNARKIVIHYRENAGKKLIHNTAIQTSRFKGFDPLIFEIKKFFAGAVAVDMWATRSVAQAGVELVGKKSDHRFKGVL